MFEVPSFQASIALYNNHKKEIEKKRLHKKNPNQ